jgi:hypothetical protein
MQNKAEIQKLMSDNLPIDDIVALLGVLPTRWGRMTPLSRMLIIETARVLQGQGILAPGQKFSDLNRIVGLIGGTKRGSLHTDQAFVETMTEGPGLASPALFGYTLANIPLAEAAVVHGLTGPVYAIFDTLCPLESAQKEARRLLGLQKNLDLMLACEFDYYKHEDRQEISVILNVIEQSL